jgi:hypothetical protein
VTVSHFDFTGPNEVKALLNVAGVHLATSGEQAFSAPIRLDGDCAVSLWTSSVDSADRNATTLECGFQDINGDGLVDRRARFLDGNGKRRRAMPRPG